MAMSKESAMGFLLVALGFGLEIICKALGIDGVAQSAFSGVVTAGLALLGLKGVSDNLKKG